jgi:glycosyltransferase involved in cell wall biosynthesis
MASILLLSRYDRRGASSRVRHYSFVPALERAGFDVTIAPLLDGTYLDRLYAGEGRGWRMLFKAYWRRLHRILVARRYDVIWIEKEALPWIPAALERLAFGNRPLVVDFDDAWYLRYATHGNWLVRALLGNKFERLVAGAQVVTTGNSELSNWAKALAGPRVVQIPSTINVESYPLLPLPEGRFTIGWIGTPSNAPYLASLAEPLRHLQAACGVRLRVIGAAQFSLPGLNIEHVPWREETEALKLAGCHVGIAPLADGPWERGKCGYKVIQYMAAGRPVVGSPVGANTSIIVPGTGFLARDAQEWISALSILAVDRDLNETLGLAARAHAKAMYSLQSNLDRVVDVLEFAMRQGGAEREPSTRVREDISFGQQPSFSPHLSTPSE